MVHCILSHFPLISKTTLEGSCHSASCHQGRPQSPSLAWHCRSVGNCAMDSWADYYFWVYLSSSCFSLSPNHHLSCSQSQFPKCGYTHQMVTLFSAKGNLDLPFSCCLHIFFISRPASAAWCNSSLLHEEPVPPPIRRQAFSCLMSLFFSWITLFWCMCV